MRTKRWGLLLFVILGVSNVVGQQPQAREILDRARSVMGFATVNGRVLHATAAASTADAYESDRTYPPYLASMENQEIWFDPESRVQRISAKTLVPSYGVQNRPVVVDDGVHAEQVRGEKHVPIHRRMVENRNLDAWATIADWSADPSVTVAGTEKYRDYPRTVLVRKTELGEQRLFVDPKTGYPVKLDFVAPHYLWGQQRVEYVWSTWASSGGLSFPSAAFRVVDGETEVSQSVGSLQLVARDSVDLKRPEAPSEQPSEVPRFLQPIEPKVIHVSKNVAVLSNPGYNEVVTEIGNEIFLFDSTQGEQRAREDQKAIEALFPGKHHINVVVTDLAWPHVAGVRYWVSQGATIISHGASRDFLQRVVGRKWTLAPDTLEKQRVKNPSAIRLKFINVTAATSFANGAIRIFPIDGIASEVALAVFVPDQKFLWASDFIQTVDEPSQYAQEVIAATKRAGIEPEKVAAEHLPITVWSKVLAAQSVSEHKTD